MSRRPSVLNPRQRAEQLRFNRETGEVGSIKTMDMLSKTYQRIPALTSTVTGTSTNSLSSKVLS
jgi:hypothetical protein